MFSMTTVKNLARRVHVVKACYAARKRCQVGFPMN